MRAVAPRRDWSDDLRVTNFALPGGKNGRWMAVTAQAFGSDLKVPFAPGYPESAAPDHGQLEPAVAVPTKPFTVDLAARFRGMVAE